MDESFRESFRESFHPDPMLGVDKRVLNRLMNRFNDKRY